MPRRPRVEYENAVYHVMARGGRREPIVFEDGDRELFLDTFAEASRRTGWQVFACVLMCEIRPDTGCPSAPPPEPHWLRGARKPTK